jgi:hypothetical protein
VSTEECFKYSSDAINAASSRIILRFKNEADDENPCDDFEIEEEEVVEAVVLETLDVVESSTM